jgi:hypothetical protein
MSKSACLSPSLALAFAAAVLAGAAPTARAQTDEIGSMNLFISPCGEPFTAPKSEPYPIVKWFKHADLNSDGKLDIDEFRADATAFFKVLDRNGDGVISSPEVTYYEQVLVPVILRTSGIQTGLIKARMQPGVDSVIPGDAQPGDGGEIKPRLNNSQGAVNYSVLREPEPVRSADRNFDYQITLAEFQAHSDRHFHTLDVNDQGFITLADLPRTPAEIAAKAHR